MTRFISILCSLFLIASTLGGQEEAGGTSKANGAALLQEIRDRIIWYSPEKTNPLLIPEDVFGRAPFEELPVPEDARQGIRMWLSLLRDWRSPTGQTYPECRYPRRAENRPVSPEKQISVEEAIAKGPVTLLVSIDQTTRGYWPDEGIYQYNEFTPLKLLIGADFPHQNPLSAQAFLSEGGEIVVDGSRLCTISPWHKEYPRKGDTYLLVGAPDDRGVFYQRYYFRVDAGNIAFAAYSELKQPAKPLSLERVESELARTRDSHASAASRMLDSSGGPGGQ